MNYEEKYKEAMERARDKFGEDSFTVQVIFPELAESEDERIRKGLIELIENWNYPQELFTTKQKIIAYLEKQKEKKPAEWSVEDESFLDSIEEAIHSYYDLNHAPQYDYWLEEKLKSLRP